MIINIASFWSSLHAPLLHYITIKLKQSCLASLLANDVIAIEYLCKSHYYQLSDTLFIHSVHSQFTMSSSINYVLTAFAGGGKSLFTHFKTVISFDYNLSCYSLKTLHYLILTHYSPTLMSQLDFSAKIKHYKWIFKINELDNTSTYKILIKSHPSTQEDGKYRRTLILLFTSLQ